MARRRRQQIALPPILPSHRFCQVIRPAAQRVSIAAYFLRRDFAKNNARSFLACRAGRSFCLRSSRQNSAFGKTVVTIFFQFERNLDHDCLNPRNRNNLNAIAVCDIAPPTNHIASRSFSSNLPCGDDTDSRASDCEASRFAQGGFVLCLPNYEVSRFQCRDSICD